MKQRAIAILWPDEQNFARFREVCGDIRAETINAYRAAISPDIEAKEHRGIKFERVEFDPERLLNFARAKGFDRAVSEVRATYAALIQYEKSLPDD